MNPQLFEHYKRELKHIREMGGEFAKEYPKVAGRLGLETLECTDPYVERLLEGFAFFAARVQLNIENSNGKLARHLLEMIYPNYLSPTPSMVIAQFNPSLKEGSLAQGFEIPRGTRMRSRTGANDETECDFRTAHELKLWPLEINDVRVLGNVAAIRATGIRVPKEARSALSITINTVGGVPLADLSLDNISLHLCGPDNAGAFLYEQIFRHTTSIAAAEKGSEVVSSVGEINLGRQGFSDDEALLPVTSQGFQGHRLVQEYFSLPERFQFFKLSNLKSRIRLCKSTEISLIILFDNADERIAKYFSKENFRLNCVPAINLFEKSADRIHLERKQHEYHIVPDRTRPMDYEVYAIHQMRGHGSSQDQLQNFFPFYSVNEKRRASNSFYCFERQPRLRSSNQMRHGTRTSYIGSEVFVSLVDADEAPYSSKLKQLSIRTLCTNRDLPIQMSIGRGETDFNLDIGAPVDSIRCVVGPTVPKPSRAQHRDAWRLVSILNMNYLSIAGEEHEDGTAAAAMLRQMLELFVDSGSDADRRQLEGIVAVDTKAIVRQRAVRGHIEIARGLQVRLRVDEAAYEGTGVYLLGSVLERFFARYASINSFTETVLETVQQNEIERWPVRLGERLAI